MPAVLSEAAQDDLRSELEWIGPNNIAKARALRDAVQIAARRLSAHPMMGRLQTDLLPLPYRFWSLTRLQIVIVYDAAAKPPRILRLLSTARDLKPLLAGITEPSNTG